MTPLEALQYLVTQLEKRDMPIKKHFKARQAALVVQTALTPPPPPSTEPDAP